MSPLRQGRPYVTLRWASVGLESIVIDGLLITSPSILDATATSTFAIAMDDVDKHRTLAIYTIRAGGKGVIFRLPIPYRNDFLSVWSLHEKKLPERNYDDSVCLYNVCILLVHGISRPQKY